MVPIAALLCRDAVPSNQDFPLVSMGTKDKLKRLQTIPSSNTDTIPIATVVVVVLLITLY